MDYKTARYGKTYDPQNPGYYGEANPSDQLEYKPTHEDDLSDLGPAYSSKNAPAESMTSTYAAPGSATNSAASASTTSGKGIDGEKIAEGAAMGSAAGPWGAAIGAVGSFASQYLAQKAADEKAKRDRYAAIQKGYGEDQQQAINQIMQNNARALR